MRRLVTVLLFFSSLPLSAQTLRVIDNMTGKPLRQAAIFIPDHGRFLETNEQGQAIITGLKDNDSLIIYYPSYSTERIAVSQLPALNYTIALHKRGMKGNYSNKTRDSLSKFQYASFQKTDAISTDSIRLLNPQTIGDALEQTGKIFIAQDYPSGERITLRGSSGNRVLIMVDGVRINNGINPGVRGSSFPAIHPEMIERADIFYGAGNVRYGSDALGGTVELTTKKANLSGGKTTIKTGDALLRFANANQEKAGGFSYLVSKKKFGSVSALYYSSFGEERIGSLRPSSQGKWGQNEFYTDRPGAADIIKANANPNLLHGTQYSDLHALQKFLFAADSNRVIGLNFQYARVSPVNRYSRLSEWDRDTPVYSLWQYGPSSHFIASMTGDIRLRSFLMDEIHLNFSSQFITQSFSVRHFGDSIRYSERDKIQASAITVHCIKNLSRKNQLEYGAETNLSTVFSSADADDIIHQKSLLTFSWYPDGGSNMNIFAFYLADKWNVSKKLTSTAGMRFSRVMLDADFNDTARLPIPMPTIRKRFSGINGNIGLAYFPSESWKISALFSSGFRAPDLNEIAKIEPMASRVILPNIDLKPESTYNAEIRLEKAISGTFHIGVTGFYAFLKDPISPIPPTHYLDDGLIVYGRRMVVLMNANGKDAQIFGTEISAGWELSKNISISTSATYTSGRAANSAAAGMPPFYGQSAIRLNEGKFRGSFYAEYNGWKRLNDYNSSEYENLLYALSGKGAPPWYTLNFCGEYTLGQYVTIQAGIKNMLDMHYRPYSSGISAPGRNIYAALRGTF